MLFGLTSDPHENRDLAAQHPEVVRALLRQVDAWWQP